MRSAARTMRPVWDPRLLGLGRMEFDFSICGMDDDLHEPLMFRCFAGRMMPGYHVNRELG
jgi:hypothetical protein